MNTKKIKKTLAYHSESILVVQKELIVRKEILNAVQLVDLLLATFYKLSTRIEIEILSCANKYVSHARLAPLRLQRFGSNRLFLNTVNKCAHR